METGIKGFGEEYKEYPFKDFWDWLIKFNDPRDIWKVQPTYLISEYSYILIGLLTFIHSQRVGGRFRWLWLGTVLHGLFVENVLFWTPEIENYWHSQTSIMLLGRRLPLHIIILYPAFVYTAAASVSRLRLGRIAEATATGLAVVLIDVPYDTLAVKFVHWTWHDTDANIFDRHYWAPWTSYYFHATFASTYVFMFHFWRRIFCNNDSNNQWISDSRISREVLCTVLAGICGMPGGILQFLPFYHPLHDQFKIHTENCVLGLFIIYFLIAWSYDRNPIAGSRPNPRDRKGYGFNELAIALILHYSVYFGMALFGKPENEISIGLHETVGPCDKWMQQKTIYTLFTGKTNERREYLCLNDYDEKYYDFKCVPHEPKQFSSWYTICGTPFENRAEYIQLVSVISFAAFFFFRSMLFRSGPEWDTRAKSIKTKKH